MCLFTFLPTVHSPHPCQHFLLSDFCMIAIVAGVMWHLIVGFIYISLMANDLSIFHMSVHLLYLNLWKSPVQILYPFLDWVICLVAVVQVLRISWMLILYQLHNLQIFFPFRSISLHFTYGFLCIAETSYLDETP